MSPSCARKPAPLVGLVSRPSMNAWTPHVHAVGSGDIHERAEVVDVAVHAAIGQQSREVQPPARPLHVRQQLEQRGVGGKFARLHRHVDAGHILIHDASGPDIEVPHFRIAHISGRRPTARPEASMRVAPGGR